MALRAGEMRVEYHCILEQVNGVIDRALEDDREIDFIELSFGEWYSFHKKLDRELLGSPINYFDAEHCQYRSVRIEKKAYECTRGDENELA